MLAVAELVARGLVDRDRYGVCRRVAPVPRMEHECFRMLALGRHSILRGRAPGRHFAMTRAAETAGFRLLWTQPGEIRVYPVCVAVPDASCERRRHQPRRPDPVPADSRRAARRRRS